MIHGEGSLLKVQEVADILAVHVRTIWRWVSEKKIPEPVRVSKYVVRWHRQCIVDWVNQGCPASPRGPAKVR